MGKSVRAAMCLLLCAAYLLCACAAEGLGENEAATPSPRPSTPAATPMAPPVPWVTSEPTPDYVPLVPRGTLIPVAFAEVSIIEREGYDEMKYSSLSVVGVWDEGSWNYWGRYGFGNPPVDPYEYFKDHLDKENDTRIVEAPENPILYEGMKVRLINGNGDVYKARIESSPLIFWGEEDEGGVSLFANFVLENPSQELKEDLYLCDFYQGDDKVYPSADFDVDRFEFDFDGDGVMETFYRDFLDGAVVYKCEKNGEIIFTSDGYPFSFMSGKDGSRHVDSTYGSTKFLGVRFFDFNDDGIYEFVIFARTDYADLEFAVYDLYAEKSPVLLSFVGK